MIIAEILVLFLFPALVVYLTKKVKLFGKVGAIALCYFTGFILSLLPINYDKNLSQMIASVLVALAIPLVLFSLDVTGVRRLAKKTIIAFTLMIVSVIVISSTAAIVARDVLKEGGALAGMAIGLYIGGTPNMFAVGSALLDDINVINLANIADSLVGGIYFLLILTVVKNIYSGFLGRGHNDEITLSGGELDAENVQNEYDYRSIPRDKKSLLKLAGVILLAVACLGVGALLEIFINGNMDGSLYIMITVSLLGIVFSFVKPVRSVKGSYQAGQYLILVFSLGLSMSIDFGKLISGMLPTFVYFTCVQITAIIFHLILCKLFHIDGGTAIITSTAGIYGPPFIAPVANAYEDRSLIIPGVICGTFGLVIGNILGIGLGGLLGVLL